MTSRKVAVLSTSFIHLPTLGEAEVLDRTAMMLRGAGDEVKGFSLGPDAKTTTEKGYNEVTVKDQAQKAAVPDRSDYGAFLTSLLQDLKARREATNRNTELFAELEKYNPEVIVTTGLIVPHRLDLNDMLTEYKQKHPDVKIVTLTNMTNDIKDWVNFTWETFRRANPSLADDARLQTRAAEERMVNYVQDVYKKNMDISDVLVYFTQQDLDMSRQLFSGTPYASKMTYVQTPLPPPPATGPLRIRQKVENVSFIGNTEHIPNLMAVEAIKTKIAPALPGITFQVAGSRSWAPHRDGNIEYHGFVPSSEKFVADSDIFISPSEAGSGIKTKMFNPILQGVPIIATPNAAEGFPAVHGVNMIIEPNVAMFPKWIEALANNYQLRVSLAEGARKMLDYFAPQNVAKLWDDRIFAMLYPPATQKVQAPSGVALRN